MQRMLRRHGYQIVAPSWCSALLKPKLKKKKRQTVKMVNQMLHKQRAFQQMSNPRILKSTSFGEGRASYADGWNDIIQQLSPAENETAAASEAEEKIRTALNTNGDIKLASVERVGSLGRRTSVPDHFDVDIVAKVKEFKGKPLRYPDDWRDEDLMLEVRRNVKQHLKAKTNWGVEMPIDAHYKYVLQLKVDNVEVDLLLVPHLADGTWEQHELLFGPVYANPEAAKYDQLRERADSGALTKVLRSESDDVKGVVRLVKWWYKAVVCRGRDLESPIGSSSLEVLVLYADQQLRSRNKSQPLWVSGNILKLELFKEALRTIDAVVNEGLVVMVEAKENWGYRRKIGMRCAHNWEGDRVKIIHPIDPTCNMARARPDREFPDWEGLAREARSLLLRIEKRTFRDLLDSSHSFGQAVLELESAQDRHFAGALFAAPKESQGLIREFIVRRLDKK